MNKKNFCYFLLFNIILMNFNINYLFANSDLNSSSTKNLALVNGNKDAKTFFNNGMQESDKKNYETAVANYDGAIDLDPNFTEAYYQRGLILLKIKKIKEAIKDFDKVINLYPKKTDAFYNRGNAYLELKQYKEAANDFNKAVELDPNYTQILYLRGFTKAKLNSYCKN